MDEKPEEKSNVPWRKVLHVALVIVGFAAWAYYWEKTSPVSHVHVTVYESHELPPWAQWLLLAVIAGGLTAIVLSNRRKGGQLPATETHVQDASGMTNPPQRQTTLNILLIILAVVVVGAILIGGDKVATFEVIAKSDGDVPSEFASWASWLLLVVGLPSIIAIVVRHIWRKKD